ncbi:hypothetical protein PROFUN_14991 [Planoprotostelium fungivorum]|uniref:Uncharacterized protein n=1 Tax=Planoprotostelium fungivorum TaxID=1890364 RepID=A0A2P6MY24_9EUKA|nr:hypothetical protein PROFUN_14991 [Planoprotostelium fungivorum]
MSFQEPWNKVQNRLFQMHISYEERENELKDLYAELKREDDEIRGLFAKRVARSIQQKKDTAPTLIPRFPQ